MTRAGRRRTRYTDTQNSAYVSTHALVRFSIPSRESPAGIGAEEAPPNGSPSTVRNGWSAWGLTIFRHKPRVPGSP